MNQYKFNVENVICVGDIHGNFKPLVGYIKQYNLHNTLLVVCGDIGLGFNKLEYYKQMMNILKRTLSKYNCYIIFVRGNHDDKSFFDGKTINDKRIKAVPDYSVISVYNINDTEQYLDPFNILCVGGAISVDRVLRKPKNAAYLMHYLFTEGYNSANVEEASKKCKKIYWEDEIPLYEPEKLDELKENNIQIDCVASHSCPSFCEPTGIHEIMSFIEKDRELEKDLEEERKVMDSIYNKLKEDGHPLGIWCYGHYHYHWYKMIDGVKFFMVDMERNGRLDGVEVYSSEIKLNEEDEF